VERDASYVGSSSLAEAVAAFGFMLVALGVAHRRNVKVPLALAAFATASFWMTGRATVGNPLLSSTVLFVTKGLAASELLSATGVEDAQPDEEGARRAHAESVAGAQVKERPEGEHPQRRCVSTRVTSARGVVRETSAVTAGLTSAIAPSVTRNSQGSLRSSPARAIASRSGFSAA
jgi:hypothetical protein